MEIMMQSNRPLIGILLFFSIFCVIFAGVAKAHPAPYRVLVVHSYHQGFAWTDDIQATVAQTLAASGVQHEIVVEYLDAARIVGMAPLAAHMSRMCEMLRAKLSNSRFEAVIVSDNAALDFMLNNGAELAPGAPLIFCGINNFSEQMLEGRKDVTGVAEIPSFAGTLELALKLRPQAKNVLVLAENTATGAANLALLKEQVAPLADRLNFDIITQADIHALEERLKGLAPDWIVLPMVRPTDEHGVLTAADASRRLAEASPVPVFAAWDFWMGQGPVAGVVVSAKAQGETAAAMAIRILNGERVENIPVVQQEINVAMADHNSMTRFGMSENLLPEGALLLNAPISFYSVNKGIVWASGVISLCLLLLSIFLAQNVARRKRAEKLYRSQLNFVEALMRAMPAPVFYKDAEGRYLGVNQAFETLMGKPAQYFIGRLPSEAFPQEHGQVSMQHDQEIVRLGGMQCYEHVIPTALGLRTLVVTKTAFPGEDSPVAGIVGILMDITALKQAEQSLLQVTSRLIKAQQIAQVGDWEWIVKEDKVTWSGQLFTLLGIDPTEKAPTYEENLALYHEESAQRLEAAVSQALSDGTSYIIDLERTKPDGAKIFVQARGLAEQDATGKVVRLYGSVQDITERKRAEEALLVERSILRDILESTLAGYWDWNLRDGTEHLSPMFKCMLGYEDFELENSPETWQRLIHPDDLPGVLEMFRHHVESRGQVPIHNEVRYRHKNGSWVWVICGGRVVEWADDGQPLRMVGCHVDITDRKHSEEELRESEERFRMLASGSPVSTIAFDEKGTITFVSDWHLQEIAKGRLDAQFFLGKNVWDLPSIISSDLCGHVRSILNGQTLHIEDVYVPSTCIGLEAYQNIRGMPFHRNNKITGGVLIREDITERKRSEMALIQSAAKLRAIIENTPIGMYLYDLVAGRLIFSGYNPAADTMLGVKHEDFIGKELTEAFPMLGETEIPSRYLEVAATGEPWHTQQFGYEDEQIVGTFEVLCFPVSKTTISVMFLDITSQKQAEAEMALAKTLAEDANRAKSEFLANLSHEIRTPLNGVLGMLQLLQQEIEPNDRATYTEMAYDAGRRLLSLLNDVLDFSKMEAGQLHLASASLSLGAVVDDVVKVFSMACQEKGLELTATVETSVPAYLVGDEARLRQILFNLIGNAIKFTPSGSVQVDVWAHPSMRFADKSRVYISVSDTGLGIPDTKQTHIFDRFTQVDASYTRRFEGAGLGLAIVKRIVDLMHGDITVDSEEGKGTTILLNFLLTNVDPSGRDDEDNPGNRSLLAQRPLRILLADDEPIGRMSLQIMLGRMGHEIHTATNGKEALETLEQGDFDCILMDIQMPEMDGVEATRIIRNMSAIGDKQNIPIIALTAYAMQGDREKFLEAGMDDHVAKPVQMEELKKALERVMDNARQHSTR